MVKFVSIDFNGTGPLLGLGLSELNIRKLKEGQPILVKSTDVPGMSDALGWEGNVLILYGKTEADMAKELGTTFDMSNVQVNIDESKDHIVDSYPLKKIEDAFFNFDNDGSETSDEVKKKQWTQFREILFGPDISEETSK